MPKTDLSAPVRATVYVAGLVLVLLAALGIGRLVGPVDVDSAPAHSADGGSHEH